MKPESMFYCGWGFLVGSFILLIVGCYEIHYVIRLKLYGVSTKGTVVNKYIIDKSEGTYATIYDVEFIGNNGQRVKINNERLSEYDDRYQIGETVDVIYLSKSITDARINDFKEIWTPSIASMTTAILTAIIGLVILKKRKNMVRETNKN